VFQDSNNNGTRDNDEPVITRVQALPSDLRISGNLNVSTFVSYAPTGEAKLTNGGFQSGTFTLCNPSLSTAVARQIVISSGRPRVAKVDGWSCA
jgi:type IV fimbrial biogenesis protein FimT